jgi:hypothetical protein
MNRKLTAALLVSAAVLTTALGGVSAVLILAGVLSPLHVPGVDMANFIGYVLWSLWLVAFAVLLLRRRVPAASANVPVGDRK